MTWLYLPPEFSASAPASEASTSVSTLPSPERALSVTWRGKHMPPQHWSRAWKRVTWLRHLSGLTLPPSTLEHGVAQWIASCREIPASPTASPETASAKTTIDGSPSTSSGYSMKAGLVVSSAKTSRGTLTDNSPTSSRHWKDWVAALRSESSARPKSAPATSESGSSSWPTATTNDGKRGADLNRVKRRHDGAPLSEVAVRWPTATVGDADSSGSRNLEGSNAKQGTSLTDAVVRGHLWPTPMAGTGPQNGNSMAGNSDFSRKAMSMAEDLTERWPTPAAGNFNDGESLESFDARKAALKAKGINGNGMGDSLAIAAQRVTWATPTARDHFPPHSEEYVAAKKAQGHGMRNLNDEVSAWPTPAARDHKGINSPDHVTTNGTGRMHMDQLPNFVEYAFPYSPPATMWETPGVALTEGGRLTRSGARSGELLLTGQAMAFPSSHPDPEMPSGNGSSAPPRSLNPQFVEWLMGWPPQWTSLTASTGSEPAGTGLSRWLLLSRGELSRLVSPRPQAQLTLF